MRRSVHVAMTAVLTLPVVLAAGIASSPAAATGPGPRGGPPAYDVVAVISDGDNAPIPRGLNETGTIVGYTGYPQTKAFLWENGNLTKLPALLGNTRRFAFDVNDAGTVVGHSGYTSVEPPQRAVRWVGGVPEDLGVLPGGFDSHAEGINEAGMIVGESSTSSGANHAFVWTEAAGMIDITPTAPPSQIARAYDVNESGQVVGYVNSRAFVWQDGVLTDLGVPDGYAFSFGFAINDAGAVAAHVTTASGAAESVALWTPAAGWQVLGGGGQVNVAWGINNEGTIVGEGRPTPGLERAFVYLADFGLLSLTELLTTDDWFLLFASDVDDDGRIIAYGSNRVTGDNATLLLEPVRGPLMHDEQLKVRLRGSPEPSSGLAKLRVVDESGNPVQRALVDGTWGLNGEVIDPSDTDRTNAAGRAKLKHRLDDLAVGDIVEFCITTVTHESYEYEPPPGGPSCDTATVG